MVEHEKSQPMRPLYALALPGATSSGQTGGPAPRKGKAAQHLSSSRTGQGEGGVGWGGPRASGSPELSQAQRCGC